MSNAYQLIADIKSCQDELAKENVALNVEFTTLHFDETNHGIGTLYITDNRVVWLPNESDGTKTTSGYAFPYLSIVLHAISTDKNHFSDPCIYMQLISSDSENIPVVRLVPSPKSKASLDNIFKSLSEMASLHSDPISDSDDDDGQVEFNGVNSI